MIFMLFSNTLV